MSGALVLFTRDLRVRDQPALAAAVREAETVVPAFVLARQLLARRCGAPNRVAFLLDSRDQLAHDRTSRLSPYLHFGCLSPATLLARADNRAHSYAHARSDDAHAASNPHQGSDSHADSFARQLCWRDFHHQVLAARPDLPHADYRPRRDRWRHDPQPAPSSAAGR